MFMPRFFPARRIVPCLGLLGALVLASGCNDSSPTATVSDVDAKAKGEAQKAAMQKAYGQNGAPTGARPKK
jgi:hypothetical protein